MPVSDPLSRSPSGRLHARDLGLPLPGMPGPLNAITDAPGVAVGTTTLSDDAAPSIRTDVTATLPRPAADLLSPVWVGRFTINGSGEMTGTHWIDESGWFTGPVTLTNTLSLGVAHHATNRWMVDRFRPRLEEKGLWLLPVAAETYDGWLNDVYGQHVTETHVRNAIDGATSGSVPEGSIGGSTGIICYEYKSGTGTASRRVTVAGQDITIGVLVQANHGLRPWLTVCGRPVGAEMPGATVWTREKGSIIAIIATDAPLLPIQLRRHPLGQQFRRHLPGLFHRQQPRPSARTAPPEPGGNRQRPSGRDLHGGGGNRGGSRAQRDAGGGALQAIDGARRAELVRR